MVEIEQLRYVRLVATDLGRAADFAERVLGLGPIDRTRELATFRSDFRDYTLAFVSGDRAVQSVGLEVRYPRDLEAILEGLRGLGLRVEKGCFRTQRTGVGGVGARSARPSSPAR